MKGKILPSLLFSALFSACMLCQQAFGTVFHADDALKPPEKPQTSFTLESYLNAYLSKSPQVRSEKNTLENALANYKNAFINAFLPSFSLSATASKTYSRYNKPGDLDEMSHFNSSGQTSGTWNLFNSGKDLLSYKSSSLEYKASKIDFDSFIQETVLSAVQKYYTLLLNKKLVDVYRSDFQIAKKQYEQDKKLYDNGLKTRSDLLSSETNYLSSQLSLFSAQNNYSNALTAFNLPLNQPGETEVKLDDKTDQSCINMPELDKDLAKALEHRHDARKRRLLLQQKEIQLKSGKRNTLPSVFANLSASYGRSFDHHESWDYSYGALVGISFDLGFFYADKKNIRQNLERNYENAKLSHEQFLRDMRDDVVQKRNALELKTQSLKISELRMKAATKKFEATQLKYKNGIMSATDLTVARQEMISAQVNHATLITELAVAKLRYRYATGENIFDFSSEDMQ